MMKKSVEVCLTWTANIELWAVGGKAVVSLHTAAGSLSRPLNRQDFRFGWALPETRTNVDWFFRTNFLSDLQYVALRIRF